MNKCDLLDAARDLGRKRAVRTAWFKVQAAFELLSKHDVDPPDILRVNFAQRFASDCLKDWSARRDEFKQSINLTKKVMEDMPTEERRGLWKHTKPSFQHCRPGSDDEPEVWDEWVMCMRKTMFTVTVFNSVTAVENHTNQDFVFEFANTVVKLWQQEWDQFEPELQDALKPAMTFCKCMVALLSPYPHLLGVTPEDVFYCFKDTTEGASKGTKPKLSECKEAKPIFDELKVNEQWKEFLHEYVDCIGTEAAHGPTFHTFNIEMKQLKKDCDHAACDSAAFEDKIVERIRAGSERYNKDVAWWRTNFREGATYDLDDLVSNIIEIQFKRIINDKSTVEDYQFLKEITTVVGNTKLLGRVNSALQALEEKESSSGLQALLQTDLTDSTTLLKLRDELLKAEHMTKPPVTQAAIQKVFSVLADTILHHCRLPEVGEATLSKYIEVGEVICRDIHMKGYSLQLEEGDKAISALKTICFQLGQVKDKMNALQKASRTLDNHSATVKQACVALHKAVKGGEAMVKKPPKLPNGHQYQTSCTSLLGIMETFSKPDGELRKVLKKSLLSSVTESMNEMKTKASALEKLAGGAPDGESWKKELKNSLSWSKVEEAWKILKECSADEIETQLETLNEELLYMFF